MPILVLASFTSGEYQALDAISRANLVSMLYMDPGNLRAESGTHDGRVLALSGLIQTVDGGTEVLALLAGIPGCMVGIRGFPAPILWYLAIGLSGKRS